MELNKIYNEDCMEAMKRIEEMRRQPKFDF